MGGCKWYRPPARVVLRGSGKPTKAASDSTLAVSSMVRDLVIWVILGAMQYNGARSSAVG